MARDDKKQPRVSTSVLGRLRSLNKQMDSVYSDTYSTDPTTRQQIERIATDTEDNIGRILSRNANDNISNLSKLYSVANLRNTLNDKKYTEEIINFFEDKNVTDALVNTYMDNKYIAELDREYDIVCKYMPMLVEALNTIKDSVLTADNFDKEYLTFRSINVSHRDESTFDQRMEIIKSQYELYDRVERWYDNTSKYGEQFVYKVPYKKAYTLLMNRRGNTKYTGTTSYLGVRESTVLLEGGNIPPTMSSDLKSDFSFLSKSTIGDRNIKLEICKDSLLDTAVNEFTVANKSLAVAEQASVCEAKLDDSVLDNNVFVTKKPKEGLVTTDGLFDKSMTRYTPEDFKTPGLLLKELERKNIVLLYLESINLGYYYLEFMDKQGKPLYTDSLFARTSVADTGYSSNAKVYDMQSQGSATDDLLRYLSAAIVSNLDDKFINNNPYLKQEIYAVLKYNDIYNNADLNTIRVTYLSPNDVEHIKFREDPDTHRGISDLAAGLITAKMWCCLNISNIIGMLTRGQDKRVYYVKQNVEQNIAQTLLNVINQIKKQNFNIMQIENMNSILGITGKFNDYIIPVGPSGDAPIQMEVMEGQNIDPQTELLDKLEEITVNSTDVPIELVRARLSVDFATQLTMSNSKFLRFVFKRQAKFEQHLSRIVTDIYNTEYDEKIKVNVVLPAPLMLNINNLSQILELIQRQGEMLAQIIYSDAGDNDAEAKQKIFVKNYMNYKLGSYIKQNELKIIQDKTDIDYQLSKKSNNNDEE